MTDKSTVLAVDDTPENLHLLMDLLKDDYAILAAKDGEKAIKLAHAKKPDIILLDVMMPGMNGYEVIEKLKSDDETRDIPVIFITALSEADDETKGLEMGAIDYITKPFNPSIVKARVKNHLALREAARLKEDVERIMRHDLKSPLSAVITLPQIMAMSEDISDFHKEMLGRIEDSGYMLLSMVNMSTALFKMERGSYQYDPQPMDLAAVVRKVYLAHEDTVSMRQIKWRFEIDGKEAEDGQEFTINGEELLCYSMLGNLISNAVEACCSKSEEGVSGGSVSVSLTRAENGGADVKIVNTGEVSAEIARKFFEKYATFGKTRGTGLGTYSALLIARAHGGDISMSSQDGLVAVNISLPA